MLADKFCADVAGLDISKQGQKEIIIKKNFVAAAVLFAVFDKNNQAHVLLTKRAKHLLQHAGEIALPGGKVEQGEIFSQTALREANEEIGLQKADAKIIGNLSVYYSHSQFAIVPVVARITDEAKFAINKNEVEHIFSVPLDFLLDEKSFQQKKYKSRIVYELNWVSEKNVWHIWGITAAIIKNIRNEIYGK